MFFCQRSCPPRKWPQQEDHVLRMLSSLQQGFGWDRRCWCWASWSSCFQSPGNTDPGRMETWVPGNQLMKMVGHGGTVDTTALAAIHSRVTPSDPAPDWKRRLMPLGSTDWLAAPPEMRGLYSAPLTSTGYQPSREDTEIPVTFLNWGFLKWGYPPIIHFNRIFRYKPSIWGTPISGTP